MIENLFVITICLCAIFAIIFIGIILITEIIKEKNNNKTIEELLLEIKKH